MEADRYLNGLIDEKLLNLHTSAPCRIISFNESTFRATVEPLFMAKEIGRPPVPRPVIENVPVIGQRHLDADGVERVQLPIYRAGDVVLVAFAERALDEVLASMGQAYPSAQRRHSLTDAIILGVIL